MIVAATTHAFTTFGAGFVDLLRLGDGAMANALGMPMNNLFRIPNLSTGMSYLLRLGAKVGAVRQVVNLADIKHMLRYDGSVVMIAVKIMSGSIERGRHAIYAYRDV